MNPIAHAPTSPRSPDLHTTVDSTRSSALRPLGLETPNAAGTAAFNRAAPPKVLLVDDHDLIRLGIKALVDDGGTGIAIDWIEAASLADAMRLYGEHADIALVLLDLNLGDCKGLQGLSQLLGRYPQARVVILSGTQDEFVVRQAKSMGATGYLHKAASPHQAREILLAALNTAASPATARANAHLQFPKNALPSKYDLVADLGARHLEILELVLCGCTNQEISNETKLSLGTVKNYVSTILLALDVRSRSHLISLFR